MTTLIEQLKTRPVATPALRGATESAPALLIEGVSKSFVVGRKRQPVAAITDVDLRLERGEIHGILGANGSGKSTLIRLISGLLTLDTGLGSFSFVGIGMIAAILPLLYVERGAQMVFVIQSCLLLVSGVYYSVEVLPDWMQVLSMLSPATYVLAGVRAGLVDGTPVTELTKYIWPLIVAGVVLIPFGLWAFGRAERYAKRTGKLKRVG